MLSCQYHEVCGTMSEDSMAVGTRLIRERMRIAVGPSSAELVTALLEHLAVFHGLQGDDPLGRQC